MNFPLLVLVLCSRFTFADSHLKAPDFTIRLQSGSVTAVAPPAHHFNLQAPIQATADGDRLKLKSKSEQELIFATPSKSPAAVEVSAFLCDDAKTFCERHQVHTGLGHQGAPAEKKSAAAAEGESHGFLLNRPDEALTLAREKHLPLMIDFFGIWCPPCNELDEEVFSTGEFQSSAARFVRLKLDADAEISWPLKSRYHVGGYPTVVFASAEGEEIGRIVGFRPKKEFLAEVDRAFAARDAGLAAWTAAAQNGDQAAGIRAGKILLERQRFDEAAALLEKIPAAREDYLQTQIGLHEKAETPEAKAKLADALSAAIREFPDSPESIERRTQLAEVTTDPKEKTALLESAVRKSRALIAHPKALIGHDLEIPDLLEMIAEAEEELGQAARAKSAWSEAAQAYAKRIHSNPGGNQERGYQLERAFALWKSGEVAQAEALYLRLESAYPREFTFWYAHASMKQKLATGPEELQLAEPLATRALEFSYGDNRLRAAQLLAKIYLAEKRADEARTLVRKTLSEAKTPEDPSIRTSRYLKSLKELGDQLAKG
ncbi:MAG: thioredoxin fold domain-containing protein [Bdellovibrionota bacterium]